MRFHDDRTESYFFRALLAISLIIPLFFSACAKSSRLTGKEYRSQRSSPRVDVHRPAATSDAADEDPKRQASQRLVDRGIAALNAADPTGAEQLFQEAINVDPSNGVAYYYLARASLQQNRSDAALGFLDKASSLIGEDPYWNEQILELKFEITGEDSTVEDVF